MKSSYELAMERLRKKDADEGRVEAPLTDEQRAAIAEARSLYAARMAEAEILHKSKVASTFDPAELEELAGQHRRDVAHLTSERDRKIERIRLKTKD